MRTFQRIVRASAAALALAAVPVLASAATPADAQASGSTRCAKGQRACDCKARQDASARDAQAERASKDRSADQEFVKRVWAAP